jgi:hypothetical protein
MKELYEILSKQQWIFARTMPQNPHWYCLRKNFANDEDFVYCARYIRENGIKEKYNRREYTLFYMNGYKYWTMGCPLHNCPKTGTILINRKPYDAPASQYDDIANDYDALFSEPQYIDEDNRLFGLIGPLIKGRILDIGCGTGRLLDYVNTDTGDYTGIDSSVGMLDVLCEKHPGANVIHDRFENTCTGEYDTIVALYGSASYLNDKSGQLIKSSLTKDGIYILMAYKPDYYPVTHKSFNIDYNCNRFEIDSSKVYEFGNYLIYTNGNLS